MSKKKITLPDIIYMCDTAGCDKGKKTVVFLHGKSVGRGVERPALNYGPFLRVIVCMGNLEITMPEYHTLFASIGGEPKDLEPGHVSQPIMESIADSIVGCDSVTLMAYSFGCVVLAKLLRTELCRKVDGIILIDPVVPRSILEGFCEVISEVPTLIIWGTHDNLVKNVESLATWFPKASFSPIDGGNHTYYLMPSPLDRFDENPAKISRIMQCKLTAKMIVDFLCAENNVNNHSSFKILEATPNSSIDLTSEFYKKLVIAQEIYVKYDHREMEAI